MKIITEIYDEYEIMPNLQLHQLRVATVASMVCDSLNMKIDKEPVVIAGLLHDMGNIIKAKLDTNLFDMQESEIKYWQEEKEKFIEKYGNNVGVATSNIAKEMGVNDKVLKLIEHNDFSRICDITHTETIEKQILKYSDLRVGPHGIMTLGERFDDMVKRYGGLLDGDKKECAEELEKQIFAHSNIKPEDINDESIKGGMESLKDFSI